MSEFKVALKVIINKNGKILVLKRATNKVLFPGFWDLPGGKMEYGENVIDAIKREIAEETGLNVALKDSPISLWSYIDSVKERQFVAVLFLAEYLGGEVRISPEHIEYKWIYPHEFANFENATNHLKAEIAKYTKSRQPTSQNILFVVIFVI